jgi:hypothetical protein
VRLRWPVKKIRHLTQKVKKKAASERGGFEVNQRKQIENYSVFLLGFRRKEGLNPQ